MSRWNGSVLCRLLLLLFVATLPAASLDAEIYRLLDGRLIDGTQRVALGPGMQLDRMDLRSAELVAMDLTAANLSHANLTAACMFLTDLTDADLSHANLTNADVGGTLLNAILSDTVVAGASFLRTLSKEQLYSTASYKERTLPNIQLRSIDLSDWDFHNQDLSGALLLGTSFVDADFSGANLLGAQLPRATHVGFTKDQLYSSASYKAGDLQRIELETNDLAGWSFRGVDVRGASFESSYLTDTDFRGASVTNANLRAHGFTFEQLASTSSYKSRTLQGVTFPRDVASWDLMGQDLRHGVFAASNVKDVDLTGSLVSGADFSDVTDRGFVKEQLYSTRSYKTADLAGIVLQRNDLSGWDLSSKNLRDASLSRSVLSGATLATASLENADFTLASLSATDLAGASITGAKFSNTTASGLVPEQLYSTASYRYRDLRGVHFDRNDLDGWDFRRQDLRGASFWFSTLRDADFTGALVADTGFKNTTDRGFNKEQLYSTASYQMKDLRKVRLSKNDLTNWDFSQQNLAGADFTDAIMVGADMSESDLTNAKLASASLERTNLTDAIVAGADLSNTALEASQLYATASHRNGDLRGIALDDNVLEGWDFNGQDLTNARFSAASPAMREASFEGTDFRGASLSNVYMSNVDLEAALFDSTTVYNQWTMFPQRFHSFDPAEAGLTLVVSPVGDFDIDGNVDANDADVLADWLRTDGKSRQFWLQGLYDVNSDQEVDDRDFHHWVHEIQGSLLGDANLDRRVDFADFVQLSHHFGDFGGWAEGDFDADGQVLLSDFVQLASNYGKSNSIAVPEPSGLLMQVLWLACVTVASQRTSRNSIG